MENIKVESSTKNTRKSATHINYAVGTQTPVSGSTLQVKASSKVEINITRQQLSEAKWLFNQFCKSKPGWLRQKFYINQRRRKCLNSELTEAQLDRVFCTSYQNTDEWYDLLHLLWHEINGELLCK
jgi:hypothetical protein